MAKFFPGMDIREVDFNRWHTHGGNGIAKRNAGMGIGCGIDDNHLKLPLGFLNPVYQFTLLVGLTKVHLHFQLPGSMANLSLDVRQSGSAINLRLARPQQIQIRPVQE